MTVDRKLPKIVAVAAVAMSTWSSGSCDPDRPPPTLDCSTVESGQRLSATATVAASAVLGLLACCANPQASTTADSAGSADSSSTSNLSSTGTSTEATTDATQGSVTTTVLTASSEASKGSSTTGSDVSSSVTSNSDGSTTSTSSSSSTGVDPDPCGGFLAVVDGDVELVAPGDKDQLFGIECIRGSLTIYAAVGDVLGLESLVRVGGGFGFTHIGAPGPMVNLEGLNNLTEVGAFGAANSELESLEGLENLQIVHGDFVMWANKLPTLKGLSSLHTIAGHLRLGSFWDEQGYTSLSDLGGLTNLMTIEGDLEIHATSLSDIEELSNLDSIGGKAAINGNVQLPTCDVLAFLMAVDIGGGGDGSGNQPDMCGG